MVKHNKRGKGFQETYRSILHYLLAGMATVNEISEKFFAAKYPKPEPRSKAVLSVLIEMKDKKYIDLRPIPMTDDFIVMARKPGVRKVIGDFPYFTLETAWDHYSKEDHYEHDLMYARAMRKILGDLNPADILDLKPERYLRQVVGENTTVRKKGIYYPDGELSFFFHGKQCVDIEIVCGGVKKRHLQGKIKSSKHHFLIIVREDNQIDNLYRCVLDFLRKRLIEDARAGMVHFISEERFFKGKFQDLLWRTPPDNRWLTLGDFLRENQANHRNGTLFELEDDDGDFVGPL